VASLTFVNDACRLSMAALAVGCSRRSKAHPAPAGHEQRLTPTYQISMADEK
jgi:hypothetical protein